MSGYADMKYKYDSHPFSYFNIKHVTILLLRSFVANFKNMKALKLDSLTWVKRSKDPVQSAQIRIWLEYLRFEQGSRPLSKDQTAYRVYVSFQILIGVFIILRRLLRMRRNETFYHMTENS